MVLEKCQIHTAEKVLRSLTLKTQSNLAVLAVAFKRRKLDYGYIEITSSSILCYMEYLYRENKLLRQK